MREFLGDNVVVCIVCGETYRVSRQRAASGKRYVCRKNNCHRYHRERRGAGENAEAARTTQGVVIDWVAGSRYELGVGQKRHDLAPLATGGVRRDSYMACVDAGAADERNET